MERRSTFEVAIFNKRVRECMEAGKRHRHLSDSWAEINYFEVKASSETEVRRQMATRYPESEGYVIDDVMKLKFDE
ncbi:MAG: hypothetical protein ISR47_06695 [Rhodospirillales bacterium]|nr:hypothetical protein [Rhodospirillales bacterium]